ncbi:MarR family winged helix-turn-helix transcriptional regulator [Streptomonospora wellingtoniae]|uniref:MarR family transcriptional regulator n=1 Tax=Streptomonospora wellingtoniae TaxID=3075544 RepID=A0ABU2KNB3_9ACTN|nr:MarR family transcriptional regulator [Streptomonospora sp. DSM 45055]MDT0300759.1 MarR family transcriptional regulator [Streptomonospora sp. DSM 45055]
MTAREEGVRWLDAEEQSVWRSLLRAQSRIEEELDRDLQARSGVGLVEFGILVALSEAPGMRMRMRVLADSVIVSKSRLSHQITRLERAGYVRREPCEEDRRGFWAILTDQGLEVLRAAAGGHVTRVRERVFDRLTREQVRQLGAVMRLLEPGDGAGGGPNPR